MVRYEIWKIFSKKGSRVVFAVLLAVLAIILHFIIGENGCVDENGDEKTGPAAIAKVRELKKEWAGPLTEEKIAEVIAKNREISESAEAQSKDFQENDKAYSKKQGFLDIRQLLVYSYGSFSEYDYYMPDTLLPSDAETFYQNRIDSLKEWLDTEAKDQFSEAEKAYLIRRYEALETPMYYDYQAGWDALFEYAPMVLMIVTLTLGFLCAGIFSGEFQQKSSAVFFSSRYGRDQAVKAKIKAGLLVVTAVYWGCLLLYTGLVLGILGADGAGCPIQTSRWKSMYQLTNLEEYVWIALGGYLGCLFLLLLTMWVSAKTNSAVVAVMVPFALIFLPSFLSGTGIPILNQVLGLLPDQLLQMNMVIVHFNLYSIGGRVVSSVPLLAGGYALLSLLLIPAIYHTYRRKQIY